MTLAAPTIPEAPAEAEPTPPLVAPPSSRGGIPTSIADLVAPGVPRREAICGCGAAFIQAQIFQSWYPEDCSSCEAEQERTRIQLAATAARVEELRAARRMALHRLDVPELYEQASLDSFKLYGTEEDQERQRLMLHRATRYLEHYPRVRRLFCFRGPHGRGKGHIAWSLAKEVAVRHLDHEVRFVKMPDFVDDIRETWESGHGGPSKRRRLARYRNLRFLVLDEVSRHAEFSRVYPDLYALLDHRLERGRPTIITTNETNKGLESMLGTALIDRLAGDGAIMEFDWSESYRIHRGQRRRSHAPA